MGGGGRGCEAVHGEERAAATTTAATMVAARAVAKGRVAATDGAVAGARGETVVRGVAVTVVGGAGGKRRCGGTSGGRSSRHVERQHVRRRRV